MNWGRLRYNGLDTVSKRARERGILRRWGMRTGEVVPELYTRFGYLETCGESMPFLLGWGLCMVEEVWFGCLGSRARGLLVWIGVGI